MSMIDINDLDKVQVLIALWNNSKSQGMSHLGQYDNQLTYEEAKKELERNNYNCDYVNGRIIKCNLSSDEFESWGYDRDNGQGAAQKAIDELRTL